MEKSMDLLFSKLEEKLNLQATVISNEVTKNIMQALDEKMKSLIWIHLESQEIANLYRIGRPSNKNRPVVVSFTTKWKKHLVQQNKTNLPQGIYLKEDYSREVLVTRKELQPKLEEERKKGNIAYLKYDKLIVKKANENNREKRKRDKSESPVTKNYTKKQLTNSSPNSTIMSSVNVAKEILKPNILNYMARGRSYSLSESSKN
ncbi:uncharacterized protein LOC131844080 [Achroia grisella]|uniref:uncharacterized protein LOC131844080 n=1 Tax=Achroia grisella TaxID=688607 RepID=UPI0027D2BBEB|nr:uncharacterized protein LOC131844080 [Achroia grisella]